MNKFWVQPLVGNGDLSDGQRLSPQQPSLPSRLGVFDSDMAPHVERDSFVLQIRNEDDDKEHPRDLWEIRLPDSGIATHGRMIEQLSIAVPSTSIQKPHKQSWTSTKNLEDVSPRSKTTFAWSLDGSSWH